MLIVRGTRLERAIALQYYYYSLHRDRLLINEMLAASGDERST